ncbi:MAG: hypothetical protein PHY08_05815, partial [Candidatus Cloacimonetes bacterium]|nr:hypothetical protein [Candidatus Cloacimonadota bacterium]
MKKIFIICVVLMITTMIFAGKYYYNFHTATDFNGMGYGGDYLDYIGLYPYDESTAVSVHNRTLRAGWNWVSFPKLQRDAETDEAVSFLTVANTLNPYGLNFTHLEYEANYDGYQWIPQLDNIKSSAGYKIEMSQNMQHSIEGTTLNPNTLISLYANQENWIGYFLPETIDFQDAFGEEVLNNIISIKSQNGALYNLGNNIWFGEIDKFTLSFGDMVIVRTNTDMTFRWKQGINREEFKKEETE